MTTSTLSPLLSPSSVAVIGVSHRREGVGRQVFENIRSGGYRGALYAVNRKPFSLEGATVYPDIAQLPQSVDLVIIAVPAAQVPATLAACGQRGIRAAVVLSAGFAEVGEAGAQLQQSALEEARRHGLRMLGPNCLGLMRAPIALNASFSRGISRPGKLALVSQSGAICSAIVDWAEARQIGFSSVVSLGAGADVGVGDVLEYLAHDESTEAILVYLEGVDHARSFISGLSAAARKKPVLVVKAGRHSAARRAAVSHTGAIVGDDAVFDAALRRTGAVRVATLHELFSAAEVLTHSARSLGNRLAIITNAGGLGVLAVDRAEDLGLPLAKLSDTTRTQLDALLPEHASRENPIDILGDAAPSKYRDTLALCLHDPGVDGIIVLLSPQAMTHPDEVAALLASCERDAQKPVLACFMGGQQVEAARTRLVQSEVSCFDSPEAAVEAFATLAAFAQGQRWLLHAPEPRSPARAAPDLAAARAVIDGALDAGRSTLSQLESKAVLQAFGIPCVAALRAKNLEAALAAAQSVGYPVALKIDSPDITHKTELGGVRLQLADAAQLRAAYADLLAGIEQRAPTARIEGVVVEPMLARAESRELLVGVSRDRALGPAIVFGAGGTLVELLRDTAVALPPLDSALARELLTRTRIAALLGTFRNMHAVDMAALTHVLLCVSDLVCELPEIKELDINPLVATPELVIALDARIVVERASPGAARHAHLAILPERAGP